MESNLLAWNMTKQAPGIPTDGNSLYEKSKMIADRMQDDNFSVSNR